VRVSFIVATAGRTGELYRLLDSLAAQTHQDIEVVVVDQNPDDRLGCIGGTGGASTEGDPSPVPARPFVRTQPGPAGG